jgi:hypothetical protein
LSDDLQIERSIKATHEALWSIKDFAMPRLLSEVQEKILLLDQRGLQIPHEDIVAPGQARILRKSLLDSTGLSVSLGTVVMLDATLSYQGLTAITHSIQSEQAAEVSLGPMPLDYLEFKELAEAANVLPRVEEAISLLNVSQYNYFHFIAQHMPQLILLEERLPHHLPIVLGGQHQGAPGFHNSVFQRLFPNRPHRVITVGSRMSVRKLHAIPPMTTNVFLPRGLKAVRERVLSAIKSRNESPPIYLRRGDQERNRRKTLNEDAVIALLKFRYPDLEVITPGSMSFMDQVQATSGRRLIFGAHGAQLTNILWAREDATLVEILPNNFDTVSVFRGLCEALELKYFHTLSMSVLDEHWANTDQVADLGGLAKLLQGLPDIVS